MWIFLYFIYEFMFKSKTLNDFTKLFGPNDFLKNDKIALRYFQ